MAKKKIGTPVNEPVVTLADIVAVFPEAMFTFPEVHEPLIAKGFVEINPAMVDGDAILTRATQEGIDSLKTVEEVKIKQEGNKMGKMEIEIESGIVKPEKAGRTGRESIYPFNKLEVGQSFFIANTEAKPNAAASLASTVVSANARFSIDDPEGKMRTNKVGAVVPVKIRTKTFSVVSCEKDGIAGARVFRDK